ncbi:NAD(P)/FAD-dependent oxidoreductase [Sphaerotilus sp.]|uniref:NAD(P)/FAD-dependent oxidoreductase n=1 Tax=Sphaerotilus sp. TaxID=2093942 RepID=UPI002ACEA560|nr:NAD(P)/FAD-dependent oxidoreductase [Sphaerotilus sp.]MDZ7856028.1 NAD(P)/FAD-dependent oxidoreductase [Sphaerotilus sp.]
MPVPAVPDTVIETDALVIGAGPVGLFQAFQLGLLGLSAHLVDVLPQAGGQCVALYADKPIYDIPAVPVCTGRELTERLLSQIAPFRPGLHFGHEVQTLQLLDDGRFAVGTGSDCGAGPQFLARSVFVAAGVGAFTPRRLKVPGLEAHAQRQVVHHPEDVTPFAGQRVLVVGGDEAALLRAAQLAEHPCATQVILLHRRDQFSADADLLARVAALRAAGRLQVVIGQISAAHTADDRLQAVTVLGVQGDEVLWPLDVLIVCLGLSPRLGPIVDWGLEMERKLLRVDLATFETRLPGVYAVGDINTYPGKKKLILCGFHEATLAAHAAHDRLRPQEHGPLLYTTSSALLHRRLGLTS